MENFKKNNSKQRFLKENLKSGISEHHKEYLGTTVPENYFEKSKLSILDNINKEVKAGASEKPKKESLFKIQPYFKYAVAASLVFIVSLTVWLQNSNSTESRNEVNFEEFAFQDDVLINSLLIEDSEIDAFADATLFSEIIIKVEMSEQKMDNLILNLLILEDSLLDDYMDDNLIETIIL
ncbi:MAG: hypothetical protein ACJA1B_002412 [Polaribacter sp.]|jgi:hypothetical protein